KRWRNHIELRFYESTGLIICAYSCTKDSVLEKRRLPGDSETWCPILIIRLNDLRTYFAQSGVFQQTGRKIECVWNHGIGTLRIGNRGMIPGQAPIDSQVMCDFPGILHIREELRITIVEWLQTGHLAASRHAQKEIGKRIS